MNPSAPWSKKPVTKPRRVPSLVLIRRRPMFFFYGVCPQVTNGRILPRYFEAKAGLAESVLVAQVDWVDWALRLMASQVDSVGRALLRAALPVDSVDSVPRLTAYPEESVGKALLPVALPAGSADSAPQPTASLVD